MKPKHLFASLAIVACAAVGWFVLGAALSERTHESSNHMRAEVAGVWGPPVVQTHPRAWFDTPNAPNGRAEVQPTTSKVQVILVSEPKRRGLFWHRTYDVSFTADYTFTNPTRIPQTFYVSFPLPQGTSGLHRFNFKLGDADDTGPSTPGTSGVVTRAVLLPAAGSTVLHASYETRGTDTWKYDFPDNRRIAGFNLDLHTNFDEINFPVGTGSPSRRNRNGHEYDLAWDYPDVLAAPSIGMDMPEFLNAGPVAARIAFFAPVSLLFFVTVILLISGLKGLPLHPMHVFFISAGFFAFHLLFAYLVDLLPLAPSFLIAAATSLLLVCGYLKAVGGTRLLKIAIPAQSVYLVVFSASFFIDGLTGITLTVLGILTLALLMFMTAGIEWKRFFARRQPPLKPGVC